MDLYVRQWACDTPYEDVMGCSSVGRSFDASRGDHGHIRNGEWDMAKRLAESGRKASPDFALLAEGSGELVSRWAMGMTSNRHYGWRDLRAHRLAHPDHILFLGGSNGGYHEMLHNCELAYLCGARFDLIMAGDVFAIRKLVRFRVALNRWAARAAYRDTLGLELDDSRVLATRHERLAGGARGVLVTAVNREGVKDAPLGVAVAVFEGKPFGAFWLDEDGGARRIEPAVTGGLLRTAVPPAGLSALLLVAEAPKDEDLLGGVVLARKPNACEARAWLCNLAPRARDIELRLDGPAGNGETRRVRLEPFGVFNAAFALPLGPGDGYVRLHAEGRELAVSYLYPLLADPSYEAKGTEAPDAPDGRRVLHFGPRKGWQGHGAALELAPGGKYLIQAKGRRTGTKGAIHGLVIMERPNGKKEYAGIHFPKDQQDFAAWVDLRAEFKAPGDLTGASLYLYNSDSEETVDYDAVRVEMLE
ncbi:MAG: hypothetical protein M5U26_10200 [Planctomycetota bacterium]|nr:hypothetical protein [Planctomycetota bacterium]